ncbi:Zinc finger, C2H2-like [Phytophthora cactorum]|nr:Zinc finger, C2H2-like [Phytophthora cactorum]
MGNLNRHMKNQHPDAFALHTPSAKTAALDTRSPTTADAWRPESQFLAPQCRLKRAWSTGTNPLPAESFHRNDSEHLEVLDETLDNLSALLVETGLDGTASDRKSNLVDDIIRFHVQELGPTTAFEANMCPDLKRMHSESGVYRCTEAGCHSEFNRKYTLAEHVKTHTGERPHLCPVPTCGKRFSTSGNLSRHKRLHGYIEPLKCPVQGCICTFPSNIKLEKHMKFHYESDVKVCLVPGCGKTFSTTGNLNRHRKNHHDAASGCMSPTPSKVAVVGSPTAAEQWIPTTPLDDLMLWSETLTAELDFTETATNQDLLEALESFLDEDDPLLSAKTMLASSDSIINSCGLKRQLSDTSSVHACTEPGCKRQFTRKYTLMEHAKTHTGERTHICPVRTCGKSFSTSGNLSRHKRLHGYIEPLKCPVHGCICTFPSNNKLEKHMKFHYGMANKICVVPGCGKTFTTTGNLNRHLKNQHSHKQEKTPILPVTMDLPAFNHGASSPTSAEQWFSLPTTAVDSLWSEDVPSWTSSSSTELFEDVWNPVLLDTLPTNYNVSPAFYSFPVQPMRRDFLPMPAFQHQYNKSVRCAEPSKPLARKRTHVCPVRSCGKRFTTSGNLSRHKRQHGKIDPLSCPVNGCICEFASTNKLERHLKFHYGGDVKHNRQLEPPHEEAPWGVISPTAITSVATPTQDVDYKTSAETQSPCAGSSDSDSDAPVEPWWSAPSEPGTSAASLDCVWSDDLLDALACILDGGVESKQETASRSHSDAQHEQQQTLSLSHSVKSLGVKRSRPAIHACTEPGCTRRFNRKYTLAEHIKTHTGERPHVCPVRTCGKRFSTSGNLSRHKRLHGYIEPLKCPVQGCICTFPSNNKLEKHMKFHYGSAVKACLVPGCGKTFSTTGNLNRHLKHQHPDLPATQPQLQTQEVTEPPVVVTVPHSHERGTVARIELNGACLQASRDDVLAAADHGSATTDAAAVRATNAARYLLAYALVLGSVRGRVELRDAGHSRERAARPHRALLKEANEEDFTI